MDPERGIKVTAMLADYACAPDGKLTVVGGGWQFPGPDPCPFAIGYPRAVTIRAGSFPKSTTTISQRLGPTSRL